MYYGDIYAYSHFPELPAEAVSKLTIFPSRGLFINIINCLSVILQIRQSRVVCLLPGMDRKPGTLLPSLSSQLQVTSIFLVETCIASPWMKIAILLLLPMPSG